MVSPVRYSPVPVFSRPSYPRPLDGSCQSTSVSLEQQGLGQSLEPSPAKCDERLNVLRELGLEPN